MSDLMASVILLTKNAGPALGNVLTAVLNQVTPFRTEIIALDSGSNDGTVERLQRAGICLYHILPAEFGFGRTKNVGVTLANGRYIVFLSQDAQPTTNSWLANLIARLENREIAAVSGRQFPWNDTNPVERYFLTTAYPGESRLYRPTDAGQFVIFSNVNAAYHRHVLLSLPFAEDLRMSEDQAWAQAALRAGHSIYYDAQTAVYHAHRYSLLGIFRRSFESGASLQRILPEASGLVRERGPCYVLRQLRYLIDERTWPWIPYALLYESCRVAGYLSGIHEHRLPVAISRRLHHYDIGTAKRGLK